MTLRPETQSMSRPKSIDSTLWIHRMRFADYAKIYVTAGRGGDGSVHFRREKYVPKGGPDGGDGGKGGSVVLKGNPQLNTILDLRYRKFIKAKPGKPGAGSRKSGKQGEDIVLDVPLGTLVKDTETSQQIGEIIYEDQTIVIAEGGDGGLGNWHFRSATHQAPQRAQEGRPGEERVVELELKLLADIGLVGFPNAGKSTLLSVVSDAKPKIASYPFTTIEPNLGVAQLSNYRSFVMADIPGIIEGAHEGKGLGLQFLRHIERNQCLLFVISSQTKITEEYQVLLNELSSYEPSLLTLPRVLAITKMDLLGDVPLDQPLPKDPQCDVVLCSSVTNQGIDKLKETLWTKLKELNPPDTESWREPPDDNAHPSKDMPH
ncbi:MAG: GTPase ObgE [Balneolaceae bacterium]|nr:GTPase ObgE [Balneolaceae bacterium]